MKLKNILKKVGAQVFKDVVPGGGVLLSVVDELLPKDKKIAPDATGADIMAQIEGLPEKDRGAIFDRQFDIKETEIKEKSATLQAMFAADAASTHTTRPYIAKHSFHVVALVSFLVALALLVAVARGESDMVEALGKAWLLITGILAPFVMLLRAYFGILKTEQENKLNASQGNPVVSGVAGLLTKIIKKG